MDTFTAGIPQSDTNPLATELERPAVEQEQQQAQEKAKWLYDSQEKLQASILDPEKLDFDFSKASDPELAKKRALVRGYILLENQGQPLPGGEVGFDLERRRIARDRFQGKGIDNEMEFFNAIQAEATQKKTAKELEDEMQRTVITSATISTVEGSLRATKFSDWLKEAKTKPGYQPGQDFKYREIWQETQDTVKQNLSNVSPALREIWPAMQKGDPSTEDISLAYHLTPKEDREEFMTALATMAKSLPAETQKAFFLNLAKSTERSTADLGRNIYDGMDGQTDPAYFTSDADRSGMTAAQELALNQRESKERETIKARHEKDLDARNFGIDLRRIVREDFDPIKKLSKGKFMSAIEGGIYAAPGAITTSLLMAVPGIGTGLTIATMKGAAYEDMRGRLLTQGLDDQTATKFADESALAVAAIQFIPEKIGFNAITRKSPLLNKAFTAISDRVANRLARFAITSAAVGVVETGTEVTQDLIPALWTDAAAVFNKDIPGTDWNAEFQDFGYHTIETFVACLPLALFGGAGGVNQDARNQAFAQADPLTRLAYGITPEDNAAIEAAKVKGPSSLNQAIENARENLAPGSESSIDAVQEIAEATVKAKELARQAEAAGLFPTIVHNSETNTFTLYDQQTNEEIGTATTAEDAVKLAATHTDSIDMEHADRVAFVTSILQGQQSSASFQTQGTAEGAGRTIIAEARLGETLTAAQAASGNPDALARIAAQSRLKEQVEGGDGGLTDVVFGQSITELNKRGRHTVNRIQQGGSILTVFHEETHGFWREAQAQGRLTQDEAITFLKGLDTLGTTNTSRGKKYQSLLPTNFDSLPAADKSVAVDEAISEWMEAEVLRSRKGKGSRNLPPGLVSKNLSSLARIVGDKNVGKFRSFIRAIRDYFGIALDRAFIIQQALAKGDLKKEDYDTFINKLHGLTEQSDFEQMVKEADQQLAQEADPNFAEQAYIDQEFPDGNPFSIGTARPTITAKQDQAYLSAVEAGNLEEAQKMVDQAAKAAGYNIRAKHGTAEKFDKFDIKKGGKLTKAVSAQKAIFLTDDDATAKSYAIYAAEDGPVMEALDRAEKAEKKGDWDTYEKEVIASEELDTYTGRLKRRENAVIIDAYIAGDFLEFDAEGKTPQELHDGDIDAGITAEIRKAIRQGKTGVIYKNLDDAINLSNRPATHYAVFKPSQIKSAAAVTYDQDGKVIPISQRFDPTDDRLAFSIGQSKIADLLRDDATARIRNPEVRAKALSRIARNLETLRLEAEKLELQIGNKRLRKSLQREAAVRQAMRFEELENQALARHSGILSDEDLTILTAQPLHSNLVTEYKDKAGRTRKRGLLMSRTQAAKRHPDMFTRDKAGEYDGADGMPSILFGGTRTPDQAADDLYRAGLISDPYPDTMWEALRREQNSVGSMKTALENAKADLRAARATSQTEAKDWLQSQIGNQELNFTPKEEILRASAMLDAILTALPAELRGKIGGYTPLARLGSDESRLAFLRDRLARADRLLENHLKKEFDKQFRKLLERARPEKDEVGKRPKGKIGADVHELFQDIRDAMLLNASETEAMVASLDILAADPEITPEQSAHLTIQSNLVSLVGNWHNASADRMESALIEGERIFARGYLEQITKNLHKAERYRNGRTALKAATNQSGHRMERVNKAIDDAKKKSIPKQFFTSLLSFEQILTSAFGRKSKEANLLVDWERRASSAKHDATFNAQTLIEDLFTTLAGGKYKGEQLRWEMSNPGKITVKDGFGNEQTFTELEALSATMMWRQEDGRRHMEGHQDENGNHVGDWNWTDEAMDSIENQLSDNAKAVRMHLTERYASEYDRLNKIYVDLYGVSLPKHKLYSPITVKPVQAMGGQTTDPVTGFAVGGNAMSPGSLKTRSSSAIAEPEFRDALQTYLAHTAQMEHWMAYAPFVTEAQALINNREVGNSIEAKGGKETLSVLRSWLDYHAQGGTRDASAQLASNKIIGRMTSRAATVALVGRVSVLAIQATQLLAAASQMPMGAFIKRLAKLHMGKLNWKEAINSDFIRRRREQMPPVVAQAMQGLINDKPSRVKFASRKMGETITGADALFTAGTYAIVYDYQLGEAAKLGLTGKEAQAYAHEAAERSTERVAQPTRAGTRSLYENLNTSPIVKLAWAFASESRQKLALAAFAFSKEHTAAERARALFVTWVAGGVVASLIRATMRDLRSDEDDEIFDERNWDPKRLALSSITGPLSGVPVIGDLFEAGVYKMFGEYLPEGNILSSSIRAGESAKKIPDWFTGDRDFEDAVKDAENIISGAGVFSGNAAGAAGFAHLIRDLLSMIDNAID